MSDPMNLCEELIQVYAEEMRNIFKREQEEPGFMNQSIFASNKYPSLERAKMANRMATERGDSILGLAIAKHRGIEHVEETGEEEMFISQDMSEKDIGVSTESFWLN